MEWSADGYAPTDYTQMTGHCHAFFFLYCLATATSFP
jgi:hypothetical protein